MESIRTLRTMCQAGKDHDPGWYAIHRRISIYLTWLMLRAGAKPTVASLGMVVCGLAGAALLAAPGGVANGAGFGLLYFAFLLDKVDGEIARYRGMQSTRGILIDRFHHRLVEPMIFVAAAVHTYRSSQAWGALILGLTTVVLANVIEEHQQLPAVVLLKYVKETGRYPAPPDGPSSSRAGTLRVLFRVLKSFRLFIVALPGLAAAYAIEAATAAPTILVYLAVSASALGAYVVFQVIDLWSGGMETKIQRAAQTLAAGAVEAPAPPPGPSEANVGTKDHSKAAVKIERVLSAKHTYLDYGGGQS